MEKIVVFDQDGVLIDSYKLVYGYFNEHYNNLSKELFIAMSAGNVHALANDLGLELVERAEEEQVKRWDEYTKLKLAADLFPGVKDLLKELNRNYTLVINTSARNSSCLPILDRHEIRDCFDFIATKEVSTSKSEKFQIIANKYKVEFRDLLFITDTTGDLEEASVYGIATIGVDWGFMGRDAFEKSGLDNLHSIADKVSELKDLIDRYFTRT